MGTKSTAVLHAGTASDTHTDAEFSNLFKNLDQALLRICAPFNLVLIIIERFVIELLGVSIFG